MTFRVLYVIHVGDPVIYNNNNNNIVYDIQELNVMSENNDNGAQ